MTTKWKIVQIIGPVVDFRFPNGQLPKQRNAIHLKQDKKETQSNKSWIKNAIWWKLLLSFVLAFGGKIRGSNNSRIAYNDVRVLDLTTLVGRERIYHFKRPVNGLNTIHIYIYIYL